MKAFWICDNMRGHIHLKLIKDGDWFKWIDLDEGGVYDGASYKNIESAIESIMKKDKEFTIVEI